MKRKLDDSDTIKEVNKLDFSTFIDRYVTEDHRAFTPTSSRDPVSADTTYLCRTLVSPRSRLDVTDNERLDDATLTSCMTLVEKTSGEAYKSSSFGWHPTRKRKEMEDKDMRYIVVYPENSSTNAMAGFLSFMFTHEDGQPVVYIYEIHVEEVMRGRGLGGHLLRMVESIGTSVGVYKTMLTVFRSNDKTVKWYNKEGYDVDEYSPPEKKLRNGTVKRADYLIMSKSLENAAKRSC